MLQVVFRAYDSSYPNKFVESVLTVYVRRNLNGPGFVDIGNYQRTIWEDFPAGELLIDVSATDDDKGVSLTNRIPNGSGIECQTW